MRKMFFLLILIFTISVNVFAFGENEETIFSSCTEDEIASGLGFTQGVPYLVDIDTREITELFYVPYEEADVTDLISPVSPAMLIFSTVKGELIRTQVLIQGDSIILAMWNEYGSENVLPNCGVYLLDFEAFIDWIINIEDQPLPINSGSV